MAEETTPIPGDYHLLTLVFPPLASKCLEDHSLPACLHVAPGAQQPGSALMLGAGVQPSTRDPEHTEAARIKYQPGRKQPYQDDPCLGHITG